MCGMVHRKEQNMDEALLIDMMSGLEAILLQNNYIEKDMRRKASFLNRFFPSKKTSIIKSENFFQGLEEDIMNESNQEIIDETMVVGFSDDNRELNISIFKKGFPNLIKIVSGIAAAFVVVSGIILFFVKHYKSAAKLLDKKAQIIY